jgi:UDP-N-acetylmuramyl pentapeptide phosphotransferase/UDP-N-acetylglucosamine-1-phosphate transferase
MIMTTSYALLLQMVLAAATSAYITWLIRPWLRRVALARPNARSSHRIPTPQGGGIAVITACLVVAAGSAFVQEIPIPLTVYLSTILISLVGLADDIKPVPVLPRLLIQAIAVGTTIFTAPETLRLFPALPLVLERAVLLLAGLWFINLVNFMDGLDLMTAAEVVPITAAFIMFGLIVEIPSSSVLVAAALCGAMLGFAPFNRPIASVFLGDVGSLPIGLLLGWCLLQLAWHQELLGALLLPLYYLADATITLFWRMSKRDPFWVSHRSHFYQCATNRGFTPTRVVVEVFMLNLLLAGLAITPVWAGWTGGRIPAAIAGVIAVALVLYRFSRGRLS